MVEKKETKQQGNEENKKVKSHSYSKENNKKAEGNHSYSKEDNQKTEGNHSYSKEDNKKQEGSHSKESSNKKIFIYRIVVSIIMIVSIILVYVLNNLGNSKEVGAMTNNISNETFENAILSTNSIDNNTISTQHVTSEESLRKLNDWRLILVNYENTMAEDYVPPLANIDSARQFDARAIDSLTQMILDMKAVGIKNIWAQSTYRSPEKQKHLIDESIQEYLADGKTEEEARALTLNGIEEPYKSEHNLGLAVDFNNVDNAFEKEPAFPWLVENAANYGFILRYPKDKENITQIKYEPWHWRYVGPEYAKEMKNLGLCLEEYIEYLKNN